MDKLEKHLYKIEKELGSEEKLPKSAKDPLAWHLTKIEELIEGGGGSGLPEPESGDEGKVPSVKADLSGFEYKEKADLVNGKVPAEELPSYVDDVLEFADLAHFPSEGEEGKIYVALDTGSTYRWSGSQYIKIGGIEVEANPSVPSGVTPSLLSGLKVDNDYFKIDEQECIRVNASDLTWALTNDMINMFRTKVVVVNGTFNNMDNPIFYPATYTYYSGSNIRAYMGLCFYKQPNQAIFGFTQYDIDMVSSSQRYIVVGRGTNQDAPAISIGTGIINGNAGTVKICGNEILPVLANQTVPSGTTINDLNNIKIGASYYKAPTPNAVSYLTTAPSSDNTSGTLQFVVLDTEPATKYNGYLYIITGSNS